MPQTSILCMDYSAPLRTPADYSAGPSASYEVLMHGGLTSRRTAAGHAGSGSGNGFEDHPREMFLKLKRPCAHSTHSKVESEATK